MRGFIFRILFFIILFLLADFGLGQGMKWLQSHAKGGETKRQYYLHTQVPAPILIFGSSRAVHHYNPIQIGDSLGTSIYNCGQGGMGILHAYIILNKIISRTSSSDLKLIVYDLYVPYDYELEMDHTKYLSYQQPFWGQNVKADSLYEEIDPYIKYKMLFSAYRFNSKFFTYLQDYLHPSRSDIKGFRPMDGELPKNLLKPDFKPYERDPFKWKYFEKFVKLCEKNNIPLVFCISPYFYEMDHKAYDPYLNYAKEHNIPVIDHYTDTAFVGHNELFSDRAHLNRKGAQIYSSEIAVELKGIVEKTIPVME